MQTFNFSTPSSPLAVLSTSPVDPLVTSYHFTSDTPRSYIEACENYPTGQMPSLRERLRKLSSPKVTTVGELAAQEKQEEDDVDPVVLCGYLDTTKNRVMNNDLAEDIRLLLPPILQLSSHWELLYSLEQHGASLHTLYDNLQPKSSSFSRVGYVLCVRDKKGGVFGSYVNEPFHPSKRFFGNGECFMWSNQDTHFKGFPYTGVNEFVVYCSPQFLSMGGGDGHYGLWLDADLNHGVSAPTLTFGNDILSREGDKFHIVDVEVWKVF